MQPLDLLAVSLGISGQGQGRSGGGAADVEKHSLKATRLTGKYSRWRSSSVRLGGFPFHQLQERRRVLAVRAAGGEDHVDSGP